MADAKIGSTKKASVGGAVGRVLTAQRTNQLLTHEPRIQAIEERRFAPPPTGGVTRETIPVKNAGADLLQFQPIALTGALITPTESDEGFRERLYLTGAVPAVATIENAIGVTVAPIGAAAVGPVAVAGLVQCRLNVQDADDDFATLEAGASTLKTGRVGVRIVWKENGVGAKWGIVDLSTLGNIQTRLAYATSGVTARSGTTVGSGTVTEYKLDGTTLTSTGETFTAYNLSTTAVASAAYILVNREPISGKWFVNWEDCS